MKKSQIDTENDKNIKISNVQRFYAFFSKVSTDFVDWNAKEGLQGKNAFSSMLRKEINAVFPMETVRNRHRQRQNFEKFPIFTNFVQFLSKFRYTS